MISCLFGVFCTRPDRVVRFLVHGAFSITLDWAPVYNRLWEICLLYFTWLDCFLTILKQPRQLSIQTFILKAASIVLRLLCQVTILGSGGWVFPTVRMIQGGFIFGLTQSSDQVSPTTPLCTKCKPSISDKSCFSVVDLDRKETCLVKEKSCFWNEKQTWNMAWEFCSPGLCFAQSPKFGCKPESLYLPWTQGPAWIPSGGAEI